MRVAVMLSGILDYQNACYRELAALGDELLLVHPKEQPYAPFDEHADPPSITRHTWETEPGPDDILPLIEAYAPDVILMSSWKGKGYRAVMKAFKGRALRVVFTSNYWHGTLKQRIGLLVHRFYVNPLFDCAWVPGQRSELFANRIGFSGRDVIRGANCADVPTFDRGPRDADEIASRRRFLFTGRLLWHKAPDDLAEAYRRYRASVEDPWALSVAGLGPYAHAFDGIDGVTMHGFVQPEQLSDLMQESSCLVLPSHLEWYGVVVHEAAVAGLPLIISDGVGAAPHLLQDGSNGWTVEAGDVDGLARLMRWMTELDAKRLGEMSDGSRALGSRLTPAGWARHLHEQLAYRVGDLTRASGREVSPTR